MFDKYSIFEVYEAPLHFDGDTSVTNRVWSEMKSISHAPWVCFAAVAGAAAPAAGGELGFVVTSWYTAIHETKYMEECPEGLAIGSDETWFESLSPADKDLLTKSGTLQPVDPERKGVSYLRGPHGEDVCWYPTIVNDAPMRVVEGKYSYGIDLDGNVDGRATATTCAHQTFTGLDGTPGVDNQLYRLIGCIYGFRAAGYLEDNANRERRDEGQGNILMSVTDVDDPLNDDAVTVSFYLAETPLPKDSAGRVMPWTTYKVRHGVYGDSVKGRIVRGKLITDPADVRLPYYGNDAATDQLLRGFRMDLQISADGSAAKGLWAGYHDLASWWDQIQKLQHNAHVGEYNCPALYRAAHELADGYPDPKTGQCTALSAAFRVEAVSAFVVKPAATATGRR